MTPENALSIKLGYFELSAGGTFTIATLAVLTVLYFVLRWSKKI